MRGDRRVIREPGPSSGEVWPRGQAGLRPGYGQVMARSPPRCSRVVATERVNRSPRPDVTARRDGAVSSRHDARPVTHYPQLLETAPLRLDNTQPPSRDDTVPTRHRSHRQARRDRADSTSPGDVPFASRSGTFSTREHPAIHSPEPVPHRPHSPTPQRQADPHSRETTRPRLDNTQPPSRDDTAPTRQERPARSRRSRSVSSKRSTESTSHARDRQDTYIATAGKYVRRQTRKFAKPRHPRAR
jgi:hypothetical protein